MTDGGWIILVPMHRSRPRRTPFPQSGGQGIEGAPRGADALAAFPVQRTVLSILLVLLRHSGFAVTTEGQWESVDGFEETLFHLDPSPGCKQAYSKSKPRLQTIV